MVRSSLWMLVSTFLFAVMAVLTKFATESLTVWEIIFFRSLCGVILCAAVLKRRRITVRTVHPWRHLLRCAIGTSCITLGVVALKLLPLGTAQTFNYSGPLWFCLFLSIAAAMKGERLERPLLLAVAAGFAGVLLVLRPDIPTEAMTGALVGVVVGFLGGSADFMIRDLSHHREPPERIVFFFTLAGTVTGFIGSLATGFSGLTTGSALLLLGIGVSATFAQLALTVGWTYGHPILNAIFQFAGIPFAVFFGFLLFGETPDLIAALGITLVAASGLAASLIRMRSEKRALAETSSAASSGK